MPSEPTEPMVAAPAVLEALALAPVAVPVAEDPEVVAVRVADDEPPVVAVVPVPVLVSEPLDDGVELEPEDAEVPVLVPVLPALAEEQLSPALMAEQKAWAAGRTSSAVVVSMRGLVWVRDAGKYGWLAHGRGNLLRAVCSPHAASTQVVALLVMSVWCWSVHWQV